MLILFKKWRGPYQSGKQLTPVSFEILKLPEQYWESSCGTDESFSSRRGLTAKQFKSALNQQLFYMEFQNHILLRNHNHKLDSSIEK
jgi:hypothetical protein